MKTLTHKDLIRLPAWDCMTAASVFSLVGYAAEHGHDAAWVDDRLARGEEQAASIYTGATLCADKGYYDRKKAEVAKAVTIEHGEEVEIDGSIFVACVLRGCEKSPRYSDPIKFSLRHDQM